MSDQRTVTDINPSQIAQALLALGADAIVATDRDGIIRHWNPGAERIFGHTAAEAVGKSLDLIIQENLRARHWEGYRHVMQTGHSRYGEGDLLAVPGLRKDGTRVSLEFTIATIRNEASETVGVAAILRDVTARFEEMKALRKQAAGRG
jgi:PAS domain S-box-containing protein